MGIIVDLFAGAGGASLGIEAALHRGIDIAVNHDATALAVHAANHPETRHLRTDVWDVKPKVATKGRKVDVLWASPDCKHFSNAKGGKPRNERVRSLAWVVCRWASDVRPKVIFLENVQEFLTWGPLGPDDKPIEARKGETFRRWKRKLEALGYVVDHRVLDASQFGAPTRRRRLFLVARCDGQPIVWPEPTHGGNLRPLRTAAECIDWNIPAPSIFDRKKPLARKTLDRIAAGIQRFVIDAKHPFIAPIAGTQAIPTLIQTGYGERKGQTPRVPGLDKPLGAVMAGGAKHALVAAFLAKHYGGVVGQPLDVPTSTVTCQDHHALTTATLASDAGPRAAQVRAFLTSYFGSKADIGQPLDNPLRTITTRDRFGLVTVSGVDYQIIDIGMRMLEPHELLRAQFGRFAGDYDLSPAKTKTAKVRLVGNSVCPEMAEAVVRANLPGNGRRILEAA